MTGVDDADRDRYFEALLAADRRAGLAVISDLLDRGAAPEAVLFDVVSACQARVGSCWQSGRLSVAQEHAATAISNEAVDLVWGVTPEPPDPRGHVVVACVENELHALPARLVAATLAMQGWKVTELGPSAAPAVLVEHLHRTGADVAAVSCTLSSGLPHARALIEAARQVGVPVVAGGAAFGDDPGRARRLGANAWASTAGGAVAAIAELPASVPPVDRLRHGGADVSAALRRLRATVLDDALGRLAPAATDALPAGELRRDLGAVFDHLVASLLVDDAGVFGAHVEWLGTLGPDRGRGPFELSRLYATLADCCGEVPEAVEVLTEAATRSGPAR